MSSTSNIPVQPPSETNRGVVADIVGALFRELHHCAPPSELDPRSRLEADLGFDSLARVELLARLERALELDLPEAALESLGTIGDLLGLAGGARALDRSATSFASPLAIPTQALVRRASVDPLSDAASLVEVLRRRAEREPHASHAIVLGNGEPQNLSYAALFNGARAIASGLVGLGLMPEATVALMLPTSVEYLESFFGVLLAGAIPVPLYPLEHRSRLSEHLAQQSEILSNAGAEILIGPAKRSVVARELSANVRGLRRVLRVCELLERSRSHPLPHASAANSIALLQYTSGSAGSPKGVPLTNKQLLANVRAMGAKIGACDTDVFVSWLPPYHDMGLVGAWLGSLYFGCACVLMPFTAFLAQPARWLHAIHRYRGTFSASPNFGYELAARRATDADLKGLDLSSLRVTLNSDEPVDPETLERFSRRFAQCGLQPSALMPVYSLAEAGAGLAFPPLGREPVVDHIDRALLERSGEARPLPAGPGAASFVSCGPPLPGYRVRIVDEQGAEVAERTEGQLQFTGPSAASGYYHNDVASAALLRGAWRNTGDRAYVAGAELYITARAKDIITRQGRHIYPQEIERAVEEVPGVRRGCVAAFGVRDNPVGTERLIVVAETGETVPSRLRTLQWRIIRQVIATTGEPADAAVLARPHGLPKTLSGKLRRTAARQAYLEGSLTRGNSCSRSLQFKLALEQAGAAVRLAADRSRRLGYGVYAWSLVFALATPTAAFALVLSDPNAIWQVYHRAARLIVRLLGIPFSIEHALEVPLGEPHVLVANHSSYADSLLMLALLDARHRFVAKAELARTPVLRRTLRKLQTLFIERYSPAQSAAEVNRIRAALHRGERIVMFPEGTFRRATGLRAFHLGAFEAAAAAHVPVVPLAFSGTRSVLRDGRRVPQRVPVRAVFGAPVRARDGEDLFAAAIRLRDEARAHILRYCDEPDLTARSIGI